MTDNSRKKFVGSSLNTIAQQRALDAIRQQGKCLPCQVVSKKGSIVTVKFNVKSPFTLPNISIPHFGPDWIRYPTQVGDLGITLAADVEIGSVTGLGGGTPDLTRPANLTPLLFMPLGHAKWSSVDPNALVLHGPNGVVLQDDAAQTGMTLTPSGIVIKIGGMTATFSSTGLVVTGGDIIADGISLKTHEHTDPQGGNSGPPH